MSALEAIQWGMLAFTICLTMFSLAGFHATRVQGVHTPYVWQVLLSLPVGLQVFLVALPG